MAAENYVKKIKSKNWIAKLVRAKYTLPDF